MGVKIIQKKKNLRIFIAKSRKPAKAELSLLMKSFVKSVLAGYLKLAKRPSKEETFI